MKKTIAFTLRELLLVCAVLVCLCMPGLVLAEGFPNEVSITLPGGATNVVSVPFTNIVSRSVFSAFKLKAVEYSYNGSTVAAGTLAIGRTASGPTYKSITLASNVTSGVSFETNDYHFLNTAGVYLSSSWTNSGTVKLIFEER